MNIRERYRRLTIWNKLAVWGSLASILGLAFVFFPSTGAQRQQVTSIDSSPGATVMQPGRDIVINPPPTTVPNTQSGPSLPMLRPQQERLLELLVGYQKQFGVSKLVVSRADGHLHFDKDPARGAEISLIRDLYGSVDAHNAGSFEQLVENMPEQYVRLIAESRWDNPFVIGVTEAGVSYLRARR